MLGQLTVSFGSYELRRRAKAFVDAMAADERSEPVPTQTASFDIDSVIEGYDDLTASAIVSALASLGPEQLNVVLEYEQAHRKRTTVIHRATQLRKSAAG
jgi:hypothetical protein